MSRPLLPYDENGLPCPNCGNTEFGEIYNSVRNYPGSDNPDPRFPGATVNDVGYYCALCEWQYGFELSKSSKKGEPFEMKPYQIILEVPRDMMAKLTEMCGSPDNIERVINDLVNQFIEDACLSDVDSRLARSRRGENK